MKEYTKNLLTAAGLSLLFIAAWDYFYAFPQLDKQRQTAIEQQKTSNLPKLGAPEKRPAAAQNAVVEAQPKITTKTRAQALAESPRIAIDTPSVSGTIALKGARLDDLSLKNYRETVDPKSPIIVLLSPEDAPQPYFAELGYLTSETESPPVLPTTETVWTADKDSLTPAQPVTLTYDNGQGLVFHRKISIDDKYLFTVEDSVDNQDRQAADDLRLWPRVAHRPAAQFRIRRLARGLHRRDRRGRRDGNQLRQDRKRAARRQNDQRHRRLARLHRQILGRRHCAGSECGD